MHVKSLGSKLFEIKHDDLRILFFPDEGRIVVLASAFIKKSQNIPQQVIRKAMAVREKYFSGKRED